MRPLVVWGVSNWRPGVGQTREIVATRTKKEAIKLIGCSEYYFNGFSSRTGNDVEVALAMGRPGVVFYTPSGKAGVRVAADYIAVEPIR